MAAQRRSSNSEENGVLALLPLACFAVGLFGGAPGIGLYIGLCFATKIFKSKPKADGSPGATDLLKPLAWHPFASTVGPGSLDSWFPTARLSFWWNALGSSLLASIPIFIEGAIPEPKLLTLPLFLVLSFLGYLFALQMIVASKRRDKPPVMIEKIVLREMTPHLASAAIVGISFGILAMLGLSHANLISEALVSHRSHLSSSPNTYAGMGLSGAIACSVGIAFIFTFATASVAYKKQWLEPHLAHEQILVGWDGAWRRVLGSRLAPPIFISEAKDPEANPEVCAALFQVQAAVTIEDYAKEADKLASALGVETALIVPDFGRDETGKPMPGVHSTSVFKVTYPLVPIVMNAHLSHDPISKSLYDFIVASTFRRIFADLKLGQPNLWAISILTTPESPGRIVETLWMLSPGITFDQVAKATNSLTEKSGPRWLRVGRRSNLLPDGVLVPMSFISVIFGDPPAMAEFANGKALKAEEHQRFVDEIEWDARFRSVGISSGGVGPNLIKSEEVHGQIRELADTDVTLRLWTFTYPPGLSPKDIEGAMPALKSSGLPYVSFRTTQNPSNFQLLTADSDPLSLTYPFTKAAPKILFEPVLGTPRLKWTVGVGPDGELVTFEFGTDDPHLLIAGMTGSGKSMSIISMVLQLATANDPRDLQFRIADPKTALVPFQNLAHVTHFVMNQTGRDRYGDFLALLEGTMRDMDRRYERLNEIEMEDLKQARASGQMMDVPFVVIVVEEASLMLMCPDKKLERAIIDQISMIANLGRGAGIYLVLATQYPSNKSIPNHLREQFSRIGFKVQDHVASNVIINESGLEDIVISGQGKMRSDGDFVQFRGFFLSPGDGPANLDLEGEETLMANPRRGGRPSDRSLVLSHLPKAEKGKVANASGPSQKVVLSPIPAGIWDDELT